MLFILNRSFEVIDNLSLNGDITKMTPYYDDAFSRDLATGAETFSFDISATIPQAINVTVGNYIAFKDDDDEFKLFIIIDTEEEHSEDNTKKVYCEMASIELLNNEIRPTKYSNITVDSFLESILVNTSWTLGIVDKSLTDVLDIDISEYTSVYEAIQTYVIDKFKAEIRYRVEIHANTIVGKYIDIFAKRGRETGIVFSYTRNMTNVTRKTNISDLVTALIGIGKNNITFRDISTEVKPAGQDFIASEEAYKRWSKNGEHIIGKVKYDTESPQELLKLTAKELENRINPKVKYSLKVELLGEEVSIGDTVRVVDHDFNPPLYLEARVSQLKTHKSDPTKDEVVLSNFKEIGTNITEEMKNIASKLEGYVDSQFPIGGDKIEDGAINGDKLHNGQIIAGTHLFANSVTADKIKAGEIKTEHLEAESITADKVTTGELITKSAQIGKAVIDSVHIKEGTIDNIHINDGSITQAKIGDAEIGTAQIKDAEITVAKIEEAFIDKIVAKEGKFESAHIGILTAENIDAETINADHIKASVIDAINLNVEGKISAERIDVSSLTVDEIDAGKITSGSIDTERLTASVIQAINMSVENATIDSAKIGDLSADKITSGEISADILKANIISAINASIGKINAEHIDVESIVVDSIDAGKITSGTIDAERITGSVVQAVNLSAEKIKAKNIDVNGLKVGSANIVEGSIQSAHIGTGQIGTAHIDKAFVADAFIKNLDASKITAGTFDTSKVTVSSTSGNLTIVDNTIQIIDANKVTRVQLGEDAKGDYGLIIQNAQGQVMWDLTGATSNGIQNGAIDNDKIKDSSVTADKLVIDSIWANEAFVSNFQSQNIDAGQIKTGKITSEYLDIEGFVKFTDLDPELSENFVRPEDEDGNILGTYINGSTIHTGTLHGDQIIANGFTAKDKLDNTTFNIDKVSGEVTMSGEVKSMNYSDVSGDEQGYKLTPDGNAVLNDATIRGSVLLPSAGITDIGKVNLIPHTDFEDTSIRSKYKTRGDNTQITWLIDDDGTYLTCRNTTLDVAEGGVGLLTPQVVGGLKAGQEYTLSFKARSSSNTGILDYIYIMSNDATVDNKRLSDVQINTYDSWEETQTITFTPEIDYPTASFLIGFKDVVVTGNTNPKGFSLRNLKLEEGSFFTGFVPYGKSVVRFWAGSDYANRPDAPFIVYADGSIKATRGEFGGVFSGKVDIGNITIEDTINSKGSISIKDNSNNKTLVYLNEEDSYFKSNLQIGEDFVNFDSGNKALELKGNAIYSNGNATTKMNNSYYILETTDKNGGHHIQRYSEGRYVFENKSKGNLYDFAFYNPEKNTKVKVFGELNVESKITMNNNIAIVARQEEGNSGFDYIVN